MTLSSALTIINSSFAATAAQSSTIASNIANVNTPGYVRQIANQATNGYGGADVVSIARQANVALLDQLNVSTSESASQSAIAKGLAALAQTVNDSATASTATGVLQNGPSPSAMLANLQSALTTYAANPGNASLGQAAVTAAQSVTASLNGGAAAVQEVRSQADAQMAACVGSINSLLAQFSGANAQIVAGLATGANVVPAQNARDSILTQLSQQVGVSTTTNSDGSMSIYTDSGVTLFQETARTLAFSPTPVLTAGASGSAVTVDGIPITGAGAPMQIASGALAGFAQLRDTIAPQYQAQLDQIAGGLVSAFAETDQSARPTQPGRPGLFTFPGATGVPVNTAVTGLAGQIEVNANVDPSQGGSVTLQRDGGISSPGNPAYTYNASGGAGYSARLTELASQIDAAQPFNPAAGLGASASLSGYANASVSWLQGQNQQANDASTFQSSVVAQASAALSNASGVNLDAEMTNMLNIENSYTTSAKLLTTVNSMFSALINAA